MAVSTEIEPRCREALRRGAIVEHPTLNGIDFVEYQRRPLAVEKFVLVVNFIKPLPDPPNSDPDGAYGLTDPANIGLITVFGGTRIVNIRATSAQLVGDTLEIGLTGEGDFSIYELALGWSLQPDGSYAQQIAALDVQFSRAPVNFKAGCPTDFDCREVVPCPPTPLREPVIDYLAKDYASFRRLLIDLIPQLNPGWVERSPADSGIALLELLAFEGDNLSYFQDAVANEAYLDTVRQRASAKKHARLVDYTMHEGRNAWTFVHFEVTSTGLVDFGTQLLSRVSAPLRRQATPPPVVIPQIDLPPESFDSDPALAQVRVFETATPVNVHPLNNLIFIHTWGDQRCCLPAGTRSAYLYCLPAGAGERQAVLPSLAVGDFLLLEEAIGPLSGAQADADPAHRQVVRLERVRTLTVGDPAYRDMLTTDGELQVFRTGDTPLPLLHVTWRRTDALAFPMCLSAQTLENDTLLNVSVARGNIALTDHGRTLSERVENLVVPADRVFRQRLEGAPLTMQAEPADFARNATTALPSTPRPELGVDVRLTKPAIALLIDFPGGTTRLWEPVRDLLDSPGSAEEFTVEAGNDGRPTVRFGDDEYGKRPTGATALTAVYRAGNGRAGNVGAEALSHAVQPTVSPGWPAIVRVRNPLPARGGVDPETIEEVRQFAPAAFRAEQFRAVIESDYTAAALKLPEVAGAVAQFRWTGSWYTVFVGIDPRDPEDLITEAGGRTRLAPGLASLVRAQLTRYKLAGYDLEIRSAEYVPIELAFELCVEPDHFRSEVVQAVRFALSNRINPDRSLGHFHPDRYTFGQPVFLSQIYAAIEAVPGVLSVFITLLRRFGKASNGEIESGVLPIGPWEIARLDNDPGFAENGVLRITAGGGK